jgi:senataxin
LGNAATLSRSGSIWANLVRNAKERQCFFNAKGDAAISRVIAKHGSELRSAKDRRDTPLKVMNNMVQVLIHWTLFSTAYELSSYSASFPMQFAK